MFNIGKKIFDDHIRMTTEQGTTMRSKRSNLSAERLADIGKKLLSITS